MPIKNHRLEAARYQKARSFGGKITPEVIILHDTAGRLEKFNSANYLAGSPRGVSVHFVVERDGTITQQVPTNRRAGHAGRSSYHNRKDVNGFSIGIEIVNPGRMVPQGSTAARAWYGELFSNSDGRPIHIKDTDVHGRGAWIDYTEEQIASVLDICEACFDYYPSLKDIRTHWYVSPGRKVDTNPLFPLEQVRARILGREEPSEDIGADMTEIFAQIHTPGSSLNMRRWPSFNPNVIATIPHEAVVPVIAYGSFDGREWRKVIFAGQEGWAVSRYLKEVTNA